MARCSLCGTAQQVCWNLIKPGKNGIAPGIKIPVVHIYFFNLANGHAQIVRQLPRVDRTPRLSLSRAMEFIRFHWISSDRSRDQFHPILPVLYTGPWLL